MKESFFKEQKKHSLIKAEIISKYLSAWSRVIIPWAKKGAGKIAYIDLFAGPGRYEDGTISTPLMILDRAVKVKDLQQMLVTIFNDADADNVKMLRQVIKEFPGIDKLTHKPEVENIKVDENIVEGFEDIKLDPTLSFIDPWGYKGVSLRLITSLIKDWACDCLFFFNYKRIGSGLFNKKFEHHMNAFFGRTRADALRKQLRFMNPVERERAIMNELRLAFRDKGIGYFRTFCFKDAGGKRTSHYLIFVSKNIKGYEIMKDIMASYSSYFDGGVPSFTYNPITESQSQMALLFEETKPLDDLKEALLNKFAGQTIAMREIYNQHHVNTNYILKNYKEVLLSLEEKGKVSVDIPSKDRKKLKGKATLADDRFISFPRRVY